MIGGVESDRVVARGLVAVVLAIVTLLPPDDVGAAHKFHASLSHIEVNSSAGTVEVAIRVFVDDLEESLSRRAGRRVRIGATAGFDERALALVNESLKVETAGGEGLEFKWIGKETSVDVVWLYVEAPITGRLEGGRLENLLFFDQVVDQVNTVNVKEGKSRATFSFKTGDSARPLSFPTDE